MRDLPEVLNWRRLNNLISLSGQPTEAQLSQIKELGHSVRIAINPVAEREFRPWVNFFAELTSYETEGELPSSLTVVLDLTRRISSRIT
jgi:hypothetical protein